MNWLSKFFSHEPPADPQFRDCTVSFTNMTDYATIAASMSHDDLPEFMNRYFDAHERAIRSAGGAICQIYGDNIMAIWSAERNGQSACVAALDQCNSMLEFHEWAKAKGFPLPKFRVGINSGSMLVGNTQGNTERAPLGDAVNTAARLEQLNKEYGTRILITGFTREYLDADLATRQIDVVRIKGKEDPVGLFELIGRTVDIAGHDLQFLDTYDAAFSSYLSGNFETAASEFLAAKTLKNDDAATDMLIARCRDLMEHPPKAGWDGVPTFRVK